jgi:NADH-quinone oxidoreductase subunit J
MTVIKYSIVTTSDPSQVAVQDLGRALLGPYGLAFELISVVLFAAMAGAILLGFKRRQ